MSGNSSRLTLSVAPLSAMWASRYGALKRCLLREAAHAGRQPPLIPQSPRAALGTGIHKMFERAAGDSSFSFSEANISDAWASAVKEVEEFLSQSPYMEGMLPLSRSVPNIGLMRSRTILRLLESGESAVPRPVPPSKGAQKRFPGKLVNRTETVVGIPDRIEFRPSGITIIDFKTGVASDVTGPFWEDYQIQLRLYAALYEIKSGRWPSRLEVHGLDGSAHEISFTPSECKALMSDAEALASTLGAATSALAGDSAAQMRAASPSREACRYCPFRPGCPAYVKAAFWDRPIYENDVAGRLLAWKTFGNGELLLELESNSEKVRIRNLPPVEHVISALSSALSGQRMIVFNVSATGQGEALFSPTLYTAVHSYGEHDQ